MAEIVKSHHASAAWVRVMADIRAAISARKVHPAHTVILVPYAQLIQQAREAWMAGSDSVGAAAFVPRFESTMNWARALGGFRPAGDDLRLDAAFDAVTARSLLQRAGLAKHSATLAPKLMEAAWSLAGVAAAVAPELRSTWGGDLAQTLTAGLDAPVLAFEAAVGRIALAWVSTSAYASDALFRAEPALLVVVDGFQAEPLQHALAQRLGARFLRVALHESNDGGPANTALENVVKLHAAVDFEDEAERAAACVLQHLAHRAADAPAVALIALDRQLTRRVRALLAGQSVSLRDETGWKLSTTRAAASLMTLLRAARSGASTDEVLDWLKHAPAFAAPPGAPALQQLERELRKIGLRDWPADLARYPGLGESSQQLMVLANTLRSHMQPVRALGQWLPDLQRGLRESGQWAGLRSDTAGRAVLETLGLMPPESAGGGEREGEGEGGGEGNVVLIAVQGGEDFPGYAMRMTASEFTAWVAQALEAANYSPPHPKDAQVVILPLSQLLGRPLHRVVMAGCDEARLQVSPEPPGPWTHLQRLALSLPTRADLAAALRMSWQYALMAPFLDVLWRTSEEGERCMASGFVQELLQPQHQRALALDPRPTREVPPQPSSMPRPVSQALPVQRLSASAYDDLRRCPYRFFALRQLKLGEADELDTDLGKRDFGNWLHRLLFHFHQALERQEADEYIDKYAIINIAAEQATKDLGLSAAEFLPFAAAWPRVRAGYLEWLAAHGGQGYRFVQGEAWKEIRLGPVTLVGKLDRLDRLDRQIRTDLPVDGSLLVMDYKTESRTVTSNRIKAGNEDTQLAFYAALIDTDDIAAAYVNVGEKDGANTYVQPDIVTLRSQLAEGILQDMQGIASGAGMPAMGEGMVCEFCAARGLCRKDMWT